MREILAGNKRTCRQTNVQNTTWNVFFNKGVLPSVQYKEGNERNTQINSLGINKFEKKTSWS